MSTWDESHLVCHRKAQKTEVVKKTLAYPLLEKLLRQNDVKFLEKFK